MRFLNRVGLGAGLLGIAVATVISLVSIWNVGEYKVVLWRTPAMVGIVLVALVLTAVAVAIATEDRDP